MTTTTDENEYGQSKVQNTTPDFIAEVLQYVISSVESYGWFILIAIVVAAYLLNKLKPKYYKWKLQQEDWREMEEAKKNPEKAHKIQMSMEQARSKLQQRVSVDSERKKEERIAKEEEDRKRKIEEWEKHQSGRGYHSKSKPNAPSEPDQTQDSKSKPKKSTFKKSEFNALSGSGGGSCSYRPSNRKSAGGG